MMVVLLTSYIAILALFVWLKFARGRALRLLR
jgi:hypothetical protein